MPRSLVLFDIDGTLMVTRGAGSRCLRRAGRIVFGESFVWTDVTVGTLDPQIFKQLAEHNGIGNAEDRFSDFRETYLRELELELARVPEDVILMPGIGSLLDSLSLRGGAGGDLVLGILTGNFEAASRLKLAAAGLDLDRFPITAFAEDGRTRNDLPRVAIRKAGEHLQEPVAPNRVFVIGDTPRDMECAIANSCIAVGVATGRYTSQDLRDAGGDLVLESLEDPGPLLDRLELV